MTSLRVPSSPNTIFIVLFGAAVITISACQRNAPTANGGMHQQQAISHKQPPAYTPTREHVKHINTNEPLTLLTEADASAVKHSVEAFINGLYSRHPLRKSLAQWNTSDWLLIGKDLRDPDDQLKRAFLECVSDLLHSADLLSASDAFSGIASNLIGVADATHDRAFAHAIISKASSIEQHCENYGRAYELVRSVIDRATLGEPCDAFVLHFCRSQAMITSAQQGLYEQAERELREWQAMSHLPSDRERFMMAFAEANMFLCDNEKGALSNNERTKRGYDVFKRMYAAEYMSKGERAMIQNTMREIEKRYPYVLNSPQGTP